MIRLEKKIPFLNPLLLIPIFQKKKRKKKKGRRGPYVKRQNSNTFFFPRPYILCLIIKELVVGRTANSPYLTQTLVVTALSSHCVEESPTNSTPSHLSQWLRAGKKEHKLGG